LTKFEKRLTAKLSISNFIEGHKILVICISVIPFILSSILMSLAIKTPLAFIVVLSYMFGSICMITVVLFSNFDITHKIADNKRLQNYFSNKWIKRRRKEFLYIIPIDDFNINFYVYDINPKSYYSIFNFENDYMIPIKTYWGGLSLNSSMPCSQKEIEQYGLLAIEAKILLLDETKMKKDSKI